MTSIGFKKVKDTPSLRFRKISADELALREELEEICDVSPEARETFLAFYEAVKHISSRTGEKDLTKIGVPLDYVIKFMEEKRLR